MGRPPVLAVCGMKNSGKTTCLEQLIRIFSQRGYRVAAVKHDGHDFSPDVPGTDSYRMQQAGAWGTAVFSSRRLLIYKEQKRQLEELLEEFGDSDLILVEGEKSSTLPKIEIVRFGISKTPVSNPEGRLGILSDIPGFAWGEERIWDLNRLEGLADELEEIIWEK